MRMLEPVSSPLDGRTRAARLVQSNLARAAAIDLDAVVADLNRICSSKALEAARLVGEYVLAKFFGGSLERFQERGRRDLSLRRLAAHPDLRLSPTFLWTAVAIVGQLRELPWELSQQLPLSHHRLLLAVRDPREKSALAARAVRGGLSRQRLAAEIRRRREQSRGAGPRTGRPPTPELHKRLREIRGAATRTLELASRPAGCDLSQEPDVLRELVVEVDDQLAALRTLLAVLRQRTSEPTTAG